MKSKVQRLNRYNRQNQSWRTRFIIHFILQKWGLGSLWLKSGWGFLYSEEKWIRKWKINKIQRGIGKKKNPNNFQLLWNNKSIFYTQNWKKLLSETPHNLYNYFKAVLWTLTCYYPSYIFSHPKNTTPNNSTPIIFFFFTTNTTKRTRIESENGMLLPYVYTISNRSPCILIPDYEKLRMLSTLSMTSKAFMRSISKSMTGMELGRRRGNGSFLLSLVGEWLLLLLSLWCLLNLVFAESNSWLLLIPGVSFLLLTYWSISWSSIVNVVDGELGFWLDNWIVLWFGDLIGDLTGDLIPALQALAWLIRWWSHTTSSRM